MSATQANQKLSMKDRITAHLPGHKNQDKNGNGIPDRMEKKTAATAGHPTLSDRNGNGIPDKLERNSGLTAAPLAPGASVVPGTTVQTTTTSVTKDVNGLPIQGNLLKDKVITSESVSREPALVQTTGFSDLNGNGIPDSLERQGSFGQTQFTDLNRNGIPDQLEGQGFGFVGSVQPSLASVVDVREAPTMIERIEKPAVVHEVYKTEEVVQIQPIIEREREQLDVYEVVQPIREREVVATEVREAILPAQTRAAIVEDNSAFLAQRSLPGEFSTKEVTATMSRTIENAPIVHETIIHKVIEEVQPVIYKEVDRPVLIKETLPIYEKIVEAPRVHHTVLPINDMGVRTTTTAYSTGFTDLNRDGIPDQLQGGAYQTTGLQSGLTSQGVFSGSQGLDLNRNGIPDSLEKPHRSLHDLNGNGIPDRMEKAHGLKDLNGNGIDDSLERRMGSASLNPNTTY